MDILIRFGFTMEEIKNMMDTNDKIEETSDKNINEILDILKNIDCEEAQIKNIFLCNPFCLTKESKEIKNLIQKIKEIHFQKPALLLDSNPYLLNMQTEELEEWMNQKKQDNLTEEQIKDCLQYDMIF
ncbi:MAG: hypothetical protein IJI60_01900 [Bacilli bacterium]|nr:hypothetical protein [Bacilli bacterium]